MGHRHNSNIFWLYTPPQWISNETNKMCFNCRWWWIKKSIIVPVPKNSKPSCLNDYRPVALTSIVMKVFERLVKSHISTSIPVTLDPLQFAYRSNRSTDDAISHILHSSLTHIDSSNGNYARLLFIDYSSAFNTIVPTKLANKLTGLGLNTLTLRLDPRLPHRQTSSGEGRPVHLKLHHPERRSPAGLRSESPAILSLHTWLCVLSQIHIYYQYLLMILWFWASFPTMMRPHTWMRWRD